MHPNRRISALLQRAEENFSIQLTMTRWRRQQPRGDAFNLPMSLQRFRNTKSSDRYRYVWGSICGIGACFPSKRQKSRMSSSGLGLKLTSVSKKCHMCWRGKDPGGWPLCVTSLDMFLRCGYAVRMTSTASLCRNMMQRCGCRLFATLLGVPGTRLGHAEAGALACHTLAT